jgi:hypothetical protein
MAVNNEEAPWFGPTGLFLFRDNPHFAAIAFT